MSEMVSAFIVSGVSIIGQLVIGYWWKRGVEAKDEKISKLEERVDEMDTRRIAGIEQSLSTAARSRKDMYERMDRMEIAQAGVARDLSHALANLPKIEEVSREMAATAAILKRVTEQVSAIEARQFGEAKAVGRLEGKPS